LLDIKSNNNVGHAHINSVCTTLTSTTK